jgi:hypothetical protein
MPNTSPVNPVSELYDHSLTTALLAAEQMQPQLLLTYVAEQNPSFEPLISDGPNVTYKVAKSWITRHCSSDSMTTIPPCRTGKSLNDYLCHYMSCTMHKDPRFPHHAIVCLFPLHLCSLVLFNLLL